MAEEKDGEAKDHDVGGGVGHQCSGGGGVVVVVVVKRILEQKKTGNVAKSAGAQIRNGTEGILSGGKDDHSL